MDCRARPGFSAPTTRSSPPSASSRSWPGAWRALERYVAVYVVDEDARTVTLMRLFHISADWRAHLFASDAERRPQPRNKGVNLFELSSVRTLEMGMGVVCARADGRLRWSEFGTLGSSGVAANGRRRELVAGEDDACKAPDDAQNVCKPCAAGNHRYLFGSARHSHAHLARAGRCLHCRRVLLHCARARACKGASQICGDSARAGRASG